MTERFTVRTEKQHSSGCLHEIFRVTVVELVTDRVVQNWEHVLKTNLDQCQHKLVMAKAKTLANALNALAKTFDGVTHNPSREQEIKTALLDLGAEDLKRFRFVSVKGGNGDRFGLAKIRRGKCVFIGALSGDSLRGNRSQIWADWSAENGRYHGHQ